jgi:hypothetical protein
MQRQKALCLSAVSPPYLPKPGQLPPIDGTHCISMQEEMDEERWDFISFAM